MSSSEKLMTFMHFDNSSTQNCDHHILLIMTGNAHKESCYKLFLILVREKGLYIIKTDCSSKMVVAFTITGKSNLILRCGAAPFLFLFVILAGFVGVVRQRPSISNVEFNILIEPAKTASLTLLLCEQ